MYVMPGCSAGCGAASDAELLVGDGAASDAELLVGDGAASDAEVSAISNRDLIKKSIQLKPIFII
jgi:hypothetical protein